MNNPISPKSKTGITGVFWYKPSKKWAAQIRVKYKLIHLGFHEDFFEACCARKSAENRRDSPDVGKWKTETTTLDRLNNRSIRVTESGCQIWEGKLSWQGYGQISYNGKKWLTHRVMWTEAHGKIPDGLCVCHRCDIPACINPDHLFLGTHQDNMDDRGRKGRAKGRNSKRTNPLTN